MFRTSGSVDLGYLMDAFRGTNAYNIRMNSDLGDTAGDCHRAQAPVGGVFVFSEKQRASINGLRLVQFRLSRVEKKLKPLERRPSSVIASIWDRMKAYKTPVVSLAIIDNFNIVAAKTYSLRKTDCAS